jgi:hypothetical protein
MSKQPEALMLADKMEVEVWLTVEALKRTAAELRRLHEVNAELLEALKEVNSACPSDIDDSEKAVLIALSTEEVRAIRAAIGIDRLVALQMQEKTT